MADVSKINLYGTEYTFKDSTARAGVTKNTNNITKLSAEGIIISYESSDESIQVSKGIILS